MQTVSSLDLSDIARLYYDQLLTNVVLRIREDNQVKDDQMNGNDNSQGNFYVDITSEESSSFRSIKAHKVLLAARSFVFARMFSRSNYKEASSSIVTIANMSYDLAKVFLKFIYTGHVDNLNKNLIYPLLYASEKYNIQDFRRLCVRCLSSHLTSELADYVLAISDCFNLNHLKQLAFAKLQESKRVSE